MPDQVRHDGMGMVSKRMAEERSWSEPIDFVEFSRDIARRRAEYEAKYGPLVIPRDKGARRTESKKALLAAIDEAAAKKGFRW